MSSESDKIYLIHPTRWSIYKIICESPGTYFYKLMSELPKYSDKASSATIIYHLGKLDEANLIHTAKIDGKRIYYPENLRELDVERAYMLLKNENARNIFKYILNNDEPFQNEIARELNVHHDSIYHHVKRLEDADLIERYKKGKYTCFKIGPLGEKIIEGSLNIISEEYVHFILENLSDSCHFPEVISKSQSKLVIRVVCPDEDDIELTINLSDFEFQSMDTDEESENESNSESNNES